MGLGQGFRRAGRHATEGDRISRLDPEEGLGGCGIQKEHGRRLSADHVPEFEGLYGIHA